MFADCRHSLIQQVFTDGFSCATCYSGNEGHRSKQKKTKMRSLSPWHLYPGGACVCVRAHTGSGARAGGERGRGSGGAGVAVLNRQSGKSSLRGQLSDPRGE